MQFRNGTVFFCFEIRLADEFVNELVAIYKKHRFGWAGLERLAGMADLEGVIWFYVN